MTAVENTVLLAALVVSGFTACAEFGSYAFVHPVIRRLPREHHVAVEQGLVRTFGRVMPVLIPLSLVLTIAAASVSGFDTPILQGATIACWVVGLVTTLIVNVGINARTARWADAEESTDSWRGMRRRWELFQGVRSWLFVAGFALLCAAVVFG